MPPNQDLFVSESLLARLDAALDIAEAEAICARQAQEQIQALLAGLWLPSRAEVIGPARGPDLIRGEAAANDNPVGDAVLSRFSSAAI